MFKNDKQIHRKHDTPTEDSRLWELFSKSVTAYRRQLLFDNSVAHNKSGIFEIRTKKIETKLIETSKIKENIRNIDHLIPNKEIEKHTRLRLKHGQIKIEARLDLHGMKEAQAHNSFNHFVQQAYIRKQRYLLVITGKGNSYASEGKLKKSLPTWIEVFVQKHYILAYEQALPKDGGAGAWYILLRRERL